MSKDNDRTIAAYEQGVALYNAAALPNVIGDVKTWIDAGLAMLPSDAHILELGSSNGRDAKYMEAAGFNVDRTDAALAFVEYMKQDGHKARVLNALSDDYGGPYDMVYANAVLLHFRTEEVEEVLGRAYAALKSDGLFSFSVKTGEGSGWTNVKLGAPRYFSYWSEEQLRGLLENAKFKVVYWSENRTGHDNGDWYHVIAKKV
jgi:predicted TPR repeat methyltransferase